MTDPIAPSPRRRAATLGLSALVAAAIVVGLPAPSSAQDLQSQLSQKRRELRQVRSDQVTLSTTITHYSNEIDRLSGEIARLRAREAAVQRELVIKEAELRRAQARLAKLRVRFDAALKALKQRLVAIYESDQPDVLTAILSSDGFDQVISRYSYMRAIDQQNNQIVATVARLRDETRSTVNQLRAVRDALAAKRDELARTQTTLQGRQASLAAAQSHKQHVLVHVRANGRQLQSDVHSIQARIQAAQAAQAPTVGFGLNSPGAVGSPFPAGTPSSGGAVSPFPASSPLTWGRTDQGVDGETAPGSPILAMGSGTVSIEHDPAGFGDSYPMLSTSFGDFYYGHCIPVVADGTQVRTGQQIAMGHYGTWGNSTTPGGFEIGSWPPGSMVAGGAIRSWLIGLPRI